MALNSFIRDFGMDGIAKSQRDTIQGNIVSTFQVSLSFLNLSCVMSADFLHQGWLLLWSPLHISNCREDR